ncbi:Stabilizer of axonemal microtubules 2 [Orchesella cincta]|uniref:Stabilizer of axonemal microtubules 2 n=1 Tax=Orchesella cincta TaxID=48709 RepID=A0A1D2MGP8_ORCCI|nr:Stabilizer of axonemal microtubules 2 [Orchesella cincta]
MVAPQCSPDLGFLQFSPTTAAPRSYASMGGGDCCPLPPVGCGSQVNFCGNHPRDDCCRIPQARCLPTLPCCTPAPVCVERVKNMKPDTIYEPPSVPFDGCSRYRIDYRGPCGAPAVSCKPTNTIDQSGSRMDGMSVYRDAYTWKPIGPIERPRMTNDYEPSTAPFEGCSSYRVDYRGCYGLPAQSVKAGDHCRSIIWQNGWLFQLPS